MIGLLKYGSGLPFNRLEGLQENLGIPLPASTQWDIVSAAYPQLQPGHEELIRQAAQGEVLYNDDTTVKILELMGERAKAAALAESGEPREDAKQSMPDRTGLFTSGVVATREGRRIALFFSGRQHAGENLQDVLRRRAADLPPPIQMCDALSRNRPAELQTIVANCLAHARRQFVDVIRALPQPSAATCWKTLEAVYRNDQWPANSVYARGAAALSSTAERADDGATADLAETADRREAGRAQLGPGSGDRLHAQALGEADAVPARGRRPAGQQPLRAGLEEGDLASQECLVLQDPERRGGVGDLYMSLIHTCELNRANPFDYLTELQRHADAVAAAPQHWLPWNYRDHLKCASDAG